MSHLNLQQILTLIGAVVAAITSTLNSFQINRNEKNAQARHAALAKFQSPTERGA